jgi:hypothetical protein
MDVNHMRYKAVDRTQRKAPTTPNCPYRLLKIAILTCWNHIISEQCQQIKTTRLRASSPRAHLTKLPVSQVTLKVWSSYLMKRNRSGSSLPTSHWLITQSRRLAWGHISGSLPYPAVSAFSWIRWVNISKLI